jgi:UDP-N-acetylmuramoylalanine--D-glutamate ligase
MMDKKKALVLGMARSGYEAAKLLIKNGYDVVINDAKAEQDEKQIKELESLGIRIILGSHPDDLFDNTFSIMVKNPGVPNNHKYVSEAQKWNIPVINEVELGYKYFPKGVTIVAVTGTNGKTTVTTIIYEMLNAASKSVYLMGNIGYPACSFVDRLKAGDIAVMEISDHQLCNVSEFKTNISVLTNLSEAHLDFHVLMKIISRLKREFLIITLKRILLLLI